MICERTKRGPAARFDVQLDRHEAKYVIPRSLVPEIRRFIRPFCRPDIHGRGNPPEYVITTLQLDTPGLSLFHAKEHEALNRFKLRVRSYGEPGESPVFLEIKRKIGHAIVKSRAAVASEAWSKDLIHNPRIGVTFSSSKEEEGFLEFVRLVREVGARPTVLIRYTRESYMGRVDHYSRVTMDRRLMYQPTESWDAWGENGRWRSMDNPLVQNKQNSFSGIVLELKTLSSAPRWMIDLVMEFNLVRTGNCKYATAMGQESLFRGMSGMPGYAVELFAR